VDGRLIETVGFDGLNHHEIWGVAGAALVETHEDCSGDAAHSALHEDVGDLVRVWNLGEGLFYHHHVGIHDVARDGGGEVVPGGAADEVPVVELCVFFGSADGILVFAGDADDDCAEGFHRFFTAVADVAVDVGDTAAAEDFGSIGEAAALVAVGGYADRYAAGDWVELAGAELCGCGSGSGFRLDFICEETEDGVGGAECFEAAQGGPEAAAFVFVEEAGDADFCGCGGKIVKGLLFVLGPGVDFRYCGLPMGQVAEGGLGGDCCGCSEAAQILVVQVHLRYLAF